MLCINKATFSSVSLPNTLLISKFRNHIPAIALTQFKNAPSILLKFLNKMNISLKLFK